MPSNTDLQYRIMVNGVEETLTSIKELETRVKELSVAWKTCSTTVQAQTQALNDYRGAQATLVTALRPATQGMQNLSGVSANAGMALLNLNYVIRDSPYFFNNFAMGVLAVGNNLNPLIDSFSRLKKEALEASKSSGQMVTTFGLLKNAMVGGAGISIAFSVLVTVMQAVVFQMSKNKTANESLADSIKKLWSDTYKATKQWEEFVKALKDMSLLDLQESLRGLNEDFEKNNDLLHDWLFSINSVTVALVMNLSHGLDMAAESMAEFIRKRDELLGAMDREKATGWIGQIRAEIKQLEEERDLISKGSSQSIFDSYNNSIKILQDQLDILLGKEKKRTKETKEQKDYLQDQAHSVEAMIAMAQGRPSGIRPAQNNGRTFNAAYGMADLFTGAEGKRTKDSMKEFDLALESGKILANQLGDALATAFNQGTITLQKFIEALVIAIAQMAILKAVTSFLTGGFGGGGATSMVASPSLGKYSLPSKPVIVVGGNIKMNSREFLVQLKTAETSMQANR
jgi:uncharacterized protein Yka (UPF0111/DUF47 family)